MVQKVIIALCLLYASASVGQSIERDVISPFGGMYSAAGKTAVLNLGEPGTRFYESTSTTVLEGFVQPDTLFLTSVPEALSFTFLSYPSPFSESFTLRFGAPVSGSLVVRDALGKIVYTARIISQREVIVNSFDWCSGFYLLSVLKDDAAQPVLSKMIKLD